MSKVPDDDENRSPLTVLWNSDCRFRAVLDSITDGIFISDPATGRFIEINQLGCRMFEKSQKSSLVGKPGLVAYDFEQIVHQGRPETPPNQGRQCSTFESLLARPMTAGQ